MTAGRSPSAVGRPIPGRVPSLGVHSVRVITEVVVSKQAREDLRSVPKQVAAKFRLWVVSVETVGLEDVCKVPGYHDEPLRGSLEGMRSIRLNQAYRAYYRLEGHAARLVRVMRVDKHRYGR